MKLDVKDIEAIGKGRVNRAESKNTTYWTFGGFALILGGVYLSGLSKWLGIAAYSGGFLLFWYYFNMVLAKKYKQAIAQLMKEWEQEQKTR